MVLLTRRIKSLAADGVLFETERESWYICTLESYDKVMFPIENEIEKHCTKQDRQHSLFSTLICEKCFYV